MEPQAGVGRTSLTPPSGVELTGWGYYIERTWENVHDPLHASALVVQNSSNIIAIVSVDLMVISADFTQSVREQVESATEIPTDHILVCCTHTHNAPSTGGLRGVGEIDSQYEEWAARQTVVAVIEAWQSREPARCAVATTQVSDLTFNRTRENGPVDSTLTALQVDKANGTPLAVLIGFQAHPTVSTTLRPKSVSRDVPGEVCDHIEHALPGCLAMYVQGACGDVNFHRFYSTEDRCTEPAQAVAEAALNALKGRETLDMSFMAAGSEEVQIPTRRWSQVEIDVDRVEAERRLRDHDITDWRETIGRVMTNRPDEMVARHGDDEWKAVAAMCRFNLEWTDQILQDLDTREETVETEIQALRIGNFGIVSNSTEFFTTLALKVREDVTLPHLMLACYANGRIGYMPDAHDVQKKSYAAYQSPKYCNQFPFTEESGLVMAQGMAKLINSLRQL